ncbi:MAG: hypothetical protein ABFS35_20095 [Bacteroidota bacterium]
MFFYISLHQSLTSGLIIRDWSFINFFENDTYRNQPSYKLKTLELLKDLKPTVFAFIRDSIDVWISRGMPNTDTFFQKYLQYIQEIKTHELTYQFEFVWENWKLK